MTCSDVLTITMPFERWSGIDAGMDDRSQRASAEYCNAGRAIDGIASPDVRPRQPAGLNTKVTGRR
jgi:hypothetical protein